MDNLKQCDYCVCLMRHIGVLQNELTKSKPETNNRNAAILELKSYFWIVNAYYNKVLNQCDCGYKNRIYYILKDLLKIFEGDGVKLESDRMKCDICRILPCELFSLLDLACRIINQQALESMYAELQYQVFISCIYDELIGRCTNCDASVEYIACIENTCKYLNDKDIHQLQEFVYFWKKATNTDEILACADALSTSEYIESSEVKFDNHVTVYLDFNVYNQYEKDPKIAEYLELLSNQEGIEIIYSCTHLEEVIRMDNKEYESIRIQSIQALTQGKIAVLDENRKKIVICIEDISARMRRVEQYQKMNHIAEERDCIDAEAREHLSLHENNEQRDKAMGDSSIQEMINNKKDDNGKKTNPNLPDEDDLNMILRYVGINCRGVKDYKDILKGEEKEFYDVRTAIVTIAKLLNVLGLHGDKIVKKKDAGAVYPIYHKNSYRTIRSGYYDNDHLSFASKCTYFVTVDKALYNKAKETYGFLGIGTIPVLLDELMNMQNDELKLI